MKFYLNSIKEVKQVETKDLPERYQHLLVPHSRKYLTRGAFGTVVTQELRGDGVTVWQHHFFIEQPCALVAHNETPAIAINYMLQGSPFAKLRGVREGVLEENKYRMFYVPIISHTVSLVKGSFHCIHVDYDPVRIKAAIKSQKRVTILFEHIVKKEELRPYLSGEIDASIKRRLNDILWYNGPDRVAHVSRLAYHLLVQYALRHHSVENDMIELEKHIEKNLDAVTVAKLVKFSCKSQRAFFRDFKEQFNTTPKKYIQGKRLEKAMQFLHRTTMPISQIATLVGLDSPQSFHKAFKKHTKMTPDAYRKRTQS